jgi:hypothetical protein
MAMASTFNEADYWARRAEKELRLAQQCSGSDANGHKTRASRYRDLAHEAMRQGTARPPRGEWF